MLKKVMIAALATSAVAMNATVSHADDGTIGCHFVGFAEESATGGQDTFTGVAVGYAQNAGWIRCSIRVDGSSIDETDVGHPTGGVAVTAGQLT